MNRALRDSTDELIVVDEVPSQRTDGNQLLRYKTGTIHGPLRPTVVTSCLL